MGAPVLDRSALPAGEITLIGLPLDEEGANPGVEGWFEMSVLEVSGRLRPFLSCPGGRSYCGLIGGIDWSGNGLRLAFTVGGHGALNPFIGLHVLDVRSGTDQRVIDSNVCRRVVRSDLAWSPDGSRLAYVCDRASGGGRALVVFEPGRGVHELPTGTTGRGSSPTWSPHSDRIACAVAEPASDIVSMRLDGSGRTVLASEGTAPAGRPTGRRLPTAPVVVA